MRTLLVSPWVPWPETWGSGIRLANIARGLARLGDVDIFVIAESAPPVIAPVPPDLPISRAEIVPEPKAGLSALQRIWWLAHGSVPKTYAFRDYRRVRSRYNAWKADAYDLVWFYTVDPYVALAPLIDAAKIVDIDQFMDDTLVARLAVEADPRTLRRAKIPQRLRAFGVRIQAKRDVRLWPGFYTKLAESVEGVVICRELDRRRLGVPNTFVVPNGYEYQPHPVGRPSVGDPPTLVFPALFDVGANIDAALYLVREILPLIRSQIPSVQVRLVGRPAEDVQRLHDPPGIVVTGFVPEIRTELAKADVVAVPARYGGGTRIKILEAFAHRIPVVSTSVGAEGIEARHGQEILLADTPVEFTTACVRLLRDEAIRGHLIDAAHRLFVDKYRWDHIHGMIASLAKQLAGSRGAPSPTNS